MNKSSENSSLKNIDLNEDWNFYPIVDWLSNRKKIFLWAGIILFASLILASRYVTMRTINAENDFFHAQKVFNQFQQATPSQDSISSSDLEQLVAIMQRHPELKPRYEGPLAQTILITGNVPQAKAFIDDIFKRTQSDHLQFYRDYTQGALLISEGRYTDALQQTQLLQSTLDELNERAPPILYVFNLIRLAMLYQQTGQPKEELQTWEQLQNQPQRLEAVLAANQIFKVGQASLNQYIEERKKVLAP
jgi:hypothetical protein